MKADQEVPNTMSNRDYIAIKAMQGLLSGNGGDMTSVDYFITQVIPRTYQIADAMIAESEKEKQQ